MASEDQAVAISQRESDLEDRVERDPFDADAWEELARLAAEGKNIHRIRSVMTRLLERFPFASAEWVRFLELEQAIGDEESVKNLLRRVLKSTYSVDIWIFYLTWLRRERPDVDSQTARNELREAFVQATAPEGVGRAMEAYPIWRMYIDFLQEEPEESPYEQGQKMDALRKVYQQVLTIPIRGLDTLWKEYQTYETSKHERTAKQLLDEMAKEFSHAAEVLKEREQYWRPLLPATTTTTGSQSTNTKKKTLPRRPSPQNNRNNIDAWMRMLNFERAHPDFERSQADQKTPNLFRLRLRLAYRRALQDLFFHPDAWYAFFDFERSVQDQEASLTVLRDSLRALPDSELMHFCLADVLEIAGELNEARSVHESLVERRPSSVAFIQRMRFARRVDGIAAAREVFRRARAFEACDPAVYCAAAEIEFVHNQLGEVARKIYDLALKRFPTNLMVMHEYLDLMLALNDENAAREVFERCVSSLIDGKASDEQLAAIYERYRDFARDHCRNLVLVSDIERRLHTQQKNSSGLSSIVHRYVLFGLSPSLEGVEVDLDQVVSAGRGRSRRGSVHEVQADAAANANKPNVEEEDSSVPPFLRKLVSILPKRLHGIAMMDVDFVMRNLTKGTLPPAPVRQSLSDNSAADASAALAVRKRRSEQLGADGAPMDAFKLRQKKGRLS